MGVKILGEGNIFRGSTFLGGQGGYFDKLSKVSEISDMTSEGLGEMFEGDSADMCAGKFPLMSMGGQAEGPHRRELKLLNFLI